MLPSSDSRKLSATDWSSGVHGYQQTIRDVSESMDIKHLPEDLVEEPRRCKSKSEQDGDMVKIKD